MSENETVQPDEQGIEPLLQAYLDDELTEAERARVDAELETNAEAQQVLEDLIALSGELRGVLSAREEVAVEVRVPGLRVPAGASKATGGNANPAGNAANTAKAAGGASGLGAVAVVAQGYRVERQLAKGGFGTVYLARQLSMDRPVALKVMAPELAANTEYVQRFLREAKLAATLRHPNLVAIYDVQHQGDRLYYSMEYVDGEDAEAVIKRDGFVPQGRAAQIAREAASALSAVSAAGIVHRDVKPANLLLTADQVKLADLGLARGEGPGNANLTVSRKVIGSPNYMSPEQAQDLRLATSKSDVYSLGATLLHMVTGALPFGRGSAVEIIARVLREPAEIPDALPSGEKFDPALKAIVADCLAKDPEARPTPAGLEARLRGYCSGAASGSTRKSTGRTGRNSKLSESGRRGTSRSVSRPRARRESEANHPTTGGGSKRNLVLAFAAVLVAALGIGILLSGGEEAPADPSTQVARDGDTTAPELPPKSTRRTTRRATDDDAPTPSVDVEPDSESPEVAALESFWAENPDAAGETFRRAETVLGLFPGESQARTRAVAVRDASESSLNEELGSLRGRSESYAQRGELWEARTQYLEFINRHGESNPASNSAQRALSALDVEIAVQLENDLEQLDTLLGEGRVDDAEALLAKVRRAAGPKGSEQVQGKLTAYRETNPKQPEPAVAVKDPSDNKTPQPTDGPADPKPTDDLAKRIGQAEELLAAARAKVDEGDADAADELLAKLRADYGDIEATKEGGNDVAAAIVALRAPKEDEILAAFFHAKTVELGEEGRLLLAYTFENELEALDWVADDLRRGARSTAVRKVLEASGPRVKGRAPWTVRKKALLGFGWGRVEHVAAFRRDAELNLQVKASGKRNVVVGFNKNESKAQLIGFNFQFDDMPIGSLEKSLKAEKIGGRDEYLQRLFRRVERSKEAGLEVAVFNENGLLAMTKLFGQRVRAKSKLGFSASIGPHSFEEDEDKDTHDHALKVKIGRANLDPIGIDGGPWARPVLAGFGYPVSFQEVEISGTLTDGFRNRLKELAKKGSLETLRERFDAEEKKKREEELKRVAREDRKRKRK